jgi:hypothetical protein
MTVNYVFKPESVDHLPELSMLVSDGGQSVVVTAASASESKSFKGSISTGSRDAVLLFDNGVFYLEAVGLGVQGLKHCREEGRYDGADASRVNVASYMRQLSKTRTIRKRQRLDEIASYAESSCAGVSSGSSSVVSTKAS